MNAVLNRLALGRAPDNRAFIEALFPGVIAAPSMDPNDVSVVGNFVYGYPVERDRHPEWAKHPQKYEYVLKVTPD